MSGTSTPPPLKDLGAPNRTRQVFFVYAGHGVGGEEFNPDLYQAARPLSHLEDPEARHVGGFDARPREYEQRVVGFFDSALLRSD